MSAPDDVEPVADAAPGAAPPESAPSDPEAAPSEDEASPRLTPWQQGLVREGAALVERLARGLAGRYDGLVTLDELRSAGHLGLTQAASTFNSSSRSFEDYAVYRVEGAMLDVVRAESRHRKMELAIDRANAVALADYQSHFKSDYQGEQEAAEKLAAVAEEIAAKVVLVIAEHARALPPDAALEEREAKATQIGFVDAVRSEMSGTERAVLDAILSMYGDPPVPAHVAAAKLGMSVSTLQRRERGLAARLKAIVRARGGR